ncbi:TPA: restriction endonuclease subunit S [Enterobacter hormaechei]|uniref:restriction endonuclease subunit S n=1 Tax=Enterobacter cloacae complex TaxID=354276 RepID=UPI001F1D6F40|nr:MULTISPECIES: restriction endonuclease subunit S [Enterobacter cloacae complex]MCM7728062.1 restriction endonuclease subunit S [Enterobacter hormaechei]HEM7461887.1 restriction endonuclease subunit S [Enterobacter hormaechei]HEM7464210.1 restriction endonuclease subunit S [Enterobacter hormaechei]
MGEIILPEGWSNCTLADIAEVNPKKIEAEQDLKAGFVPMSHAPTNYNGKLEFEEKTWGEIGKSYTNFKNDDVIFAKVTPCFENGKAAIVKDMPNNIGAGSSEFYVIRARNHEIPASYLLGIIKTRKFMQEGAGSMTGAVGLRRVPRAFVESFPLILPPLAEQKVIADKLDTLLAQVDSVKARLEQIPQILKRFRQAVLAAAVSGKLTETWRTRNPNKTTQNLLKNHIPLPRPARWKTRSTSLIQGVHATAVGNPKESPVAEWEWVPLVDVARMESGHTPSRNKPEYWGGEVCWIGIRDANRNHSSTILDTEQKTNELGLANSASRLLPKGTVCISRTASVGYVVKMGKPMATSQDFVNWVPSDVIDANWLKWLFVSERESLFRFGKGSTHTTIYFPEWLSLHILLPHLLEQQEIVRRVEQLFAYADTIEKQVQNALERVNNLTHSILAKAFRGELTAQWRVENPDLISGENSAQALLAKIQQQRKSTKTIKRSKGNS